MKFKPFDKLVFDKCDPPSRDAVSKWVKMKWGLEAKENPNRYAVDLIAYRDGKPVGYIEVEQRDWLNNQPVCPYDTIHIAARKSKLFENDKKTLVFVCTFDLTHAYWIDARKIQSSPCIEIKNRAVSDGEYFYDVPTELWHYVNLTDPF